MSFSGEDASMDKLRQAWHLALIFAQIAVLWLEVQILRLEFMRVWKRLGRLERRNAEARRRGGVLASLRPYEDIWR
jgi:hypothetical protein